MYDFYWYNPNFLPLFFIFTPFFNISTRKTRQNQRIAVKKTTIIKPVSQSYIKRWRHFSVPANNSKSFIKACFLCQIIKKVAEKFVVSWKMCNFAALNTKSITIWTDITTIHGGGVTRDLNSRGIRSCVLYLQ